MMRHILVYLTLVLWLFLMECGSGYARAQKRLNGYSTNDGDELSNLSTNEAPQVFRPGMIDPKTSWSSFLTHDRHRKQPKPCKMCSHISKIGPRGPRGPPGPPGPPGAEITKEVMMKEFKEMVRDAAERRAERLLAERCPGCAKKINGTYYIPLVGSEEFTMVPKIAAAFHCKLRGNVVVSKRTFLELQNFQVPFGGGAFQRGDVFNTKEGRFTATGEGIYQFTVNIHITQDFSQKRRRSYKSLKKRDNIRVLICIESLCQKHTSLEFISGLESNSRVFTISVSGLLHLEEGQYTSVYIDNSSSYQVTVQSGSTFTGLLVGV